MFDDGYFSGNHCSHHNQITESSFRRKGGGEVENVKECQDLVDEMQ